MPSDPNSYLDPIPRGVVRDRREHSGTPGIQVRNRRSLLFLLLLCAAFWVALWAAVFWFLVGGVLS